MMTVCLPPDWTAQCGDLWTHAVHDIFPKQAGEVTSGSQILLIGRTAVSDGLGVGSLQVVFGFR